MERCPKCGRLLEVIECCGGGIFVCEDCKEYYFYGELIQSPLEEGFSKAQGHTPLEEDLHKEPYKPHEI